MDNKLTTSIYQDKKTKKWIWRIKYNNDLGQFVDKKSIGYKTKKDAKLSLLKYQVCNNIVNCDKIEDIKSNIIEKNLEVNCPITLKFLYNKYINFSKVRLKSSSLRSASDCLEKFVLNYFGEDKIIGTLKATDIIEWQTYILSKNFSFKYNSKIYCSLTALLNYGVKFYDLSYNVAEKVGNFKNTAPKKMMSFWTEDEFKAFYSLNKDSDYKLFYTVLYFTGMRKGELLACTWNDINLDNKEIIVSKSLNRKKPQKDFYQEDEGGTYSSIGWHNIGKRCYEITTTKTKSSFRRIALPENLVKILIEYYNKCNKIYNFSKDWFIFGRELPFSDQTLRRKFDEMAINAGIKKIRIHDLRHSHASLLINKGQNILIVSQRLGHSDVKQTLNTYSHLMPNAQKEILNAINIDL